MKSRKTISSALAACALAGATALSGCTAQSDGNIDNTLAFDVYAASATFDLGGAQNAGAGLGEDIYLDSMSLVLPVRLRDCDTKPLRDSILAYAGADPKLPVARSVNQWLQATAEQQGADIVRVDNPDADPRGFDIVNGFVANLSDEMLVYCLRAQSYQPGAAHGLTTRRYINYMLKGKGQVLDLGYIFTPQGLKDLPVRISEQADAMSDVIGATSIDGLPSNDNFYISSEGEIVFSYQPYEVASYAQGTIDIPFYPYELVDLMTPSGIALFHLEDLDK